MRPFLLLAALLFLAAPARAEAVADDQKQAIHDTLQRLYQAYQTKDVDAVMGLIAGAVETTAREYQAQHPEKPNAEQAIREAFLAFHEDIFRHADYRLLDFQDGFLNYSVNADGSVDVQSSVPVIATDPMTFDDEGTPVTVNLRIGHFVLVPEDGRWRIVKMDLF